MPKNRKCTRNSEFYEDNPIADLDAKNVFAKPYSSWESG
jgi:hypothetical protein